MLVPIFFIVTGIGFDIRALFNPTTFAMLLVFLAALLVIRGIPGSLSAPVGATFRDRVSLGLMAATGLPIIVAVTNIALDQGELAPATATALVGAGMLSVLLFPLIAVTMQGKAATGRLPVGHDDPPTLLPPEASGFTDGKGGADGGT